MEGLIRNISIKILKIEKSIKWDKSVVDPRLTSSIKFRKKANLDPKEASPKKIEQVKKTSKSVIKCHQALQLRLQSKKSLLKTKKQLKMKAQLKI